MPRSRFAKPEFFDDPVLARCSHPARLLFVATWQVADRSGVFEWDIAKLRKYAFGYEDITTLQVAAMLAELLKHGFIKHAIFQDREYGFVVNLAKHQKFHVAEKSRFEDVRVGAVWTASMLEHEETTPGTLPAPPKHPADTVPESLSLETETETETETDLPSTSKRKPRTKLLPGALQPPGRTIAVREAWLKAFAAKYPTLPIAWGKRENGQVTNLLGTFTSEQLVELVPYFFAWQRPEVIKAGHSFGTGGNCFVLKIHELRADIADRDRRKTAAQITEREKLRDTIAVDDDQLNRINALAQLKDPFTGEGYETDGHRLPAASVDGLAHRDAGPLARIDPPDVRGTQQTLERRSGDDLVQVVGALR